MTTVKPPATNGHRPSTPRRSITTTHEVSDAGPAAVDLAGLRSVLDTLPTRVMLCDLDLNIQYVNEATREGLRRLAEHLPVDVENIVGANIDVFHRNPAHQRNVLASEANLPVHSVISVGPETLDLTVQALHDADGAYCGAMAVWEVITDRLRLEAEKAESVADSTAVTAVLEALSAASTPEEAARAALDTVRREFDWAYGSYWAIAEDNALHFRVESGDAGEEFRRVTLAASFTEGVGLSGRAWRNRDLFFTPDIGEMTDCVRAPVAQRVGVKSGVCFPIMIEGQVVGTMDFFTTKTLNPSQQRLDVLRNVGGLVSQSMQRISRQDAERAAAEELQSKVDQMLDVVSAAAGGDLTRDVPVRGEDAIGRLGSGLESLLTTLRASMSELGRTTDSLAAAAEELSVLSSSMTDGANQTSDRATNVTAAAEQVSTSIQTVATAAEEMTASISEISRNAADAASVATSAVGVARDARTTVTSLGESSAEIGQVIKVITSIAQQTNLLALNATIEAARAGDAGKGFAVVANEVKELAKETARATEDISSRIEAIQTDTRGAVDGIAEIASVIDRINDIQTTIASAVEEQTATTNEIARSVTEAASGATGISADISTVAGAARVTQQGSSETQDSAAALAGMAVELRQLLGQFRY